LLGNIKGHQKGSVQAVKSKVAITQQNTELHLILFITHHLGQPFIFFKKSRIIQRVSTQEKIGHLHQTTRCHIPKDSNHRTQGREKIISEI
jgi:hypothetical protein